jgi:osmotically-inducible protein OsmY
MSVFNHVLPVSLVGFVLVVSPAQGATAGRANATVSAAAQADDKALASQIESNLKKDSILAPRNIDVDVDHGIVKLTGTVRTTAERSRATGIAKVKGIAHVDNLIEVDPKIDQSKIDTAAAKTKSGLTKAVDATATAAQKTKEAVQKGVGKTEEGVGKAADKTSDAVGKAGDKLSDTAVTTRVKTGLSGDNLLKDTAIDVDTSDHVVTLRGTVGSSAAKDRAAEIAGGIEGVARVVNQLVVR